MDPRRNGSETACGLHPKPSLSVKHDCTALIDVKPTRINVDDVLELIQTKANIYHRAGGGMWRVRGDLEWRIYGRTLKYQHSHRMRYAGGVGGEEENRYGD
ncbi:hypothetical protein F2Q69_00051846 [Brassica cretica]|uniref:Uncharacterized protein n=1 Tax=Brassica cretica TaxID=69181 RepID=A0A8S9PWE0_BRACR|nr:hypothetical protein F2Q69_00051846 [Brassica cretica]